jgi:hypothetical protein
MDDIAELGADRYAIRMTEHHPTYFIAAIVAIMTAVLLRLVGMPAPWPPAIALYVYGALAWPALRHRIPTIKPTMYAMIWLGAVLVLMMYEALGQAAKLS